MGNELAPQETAALLEKAIIEGDLAKLSSADRMDYYGRVCESLGLNPLTRPFDFMKDQEGRLRLYARKDCADQLRKIHGISTRILKAEVMDGIYSVMVEATDATGRSDMDLGAVAIAGLNGDKLVNAMLKAITKAKRRVTFSICGQGLLDETELETIPGVTTVVLEDLEIEAIQAEVNGWLKAGKFTKTAMEGWARDLGFPQDGQGKLLWKQAQLDHWNVLRETARVYAEKPPEAAPGATE